MDETAQVAYLAQRRIIQSVLADMRKKQATRNARLLETHISWVLLAGRYAYKVKKAVNLGFLDFSSLELRRYYCEEEIRLNRRLAPNIYLDVITIGGNIGEPALGAQPAIEYAVRMRRFALSRQLDRLALKNKLLPQHIDSLAASIADFHASLPAAASSSTYATAENIYKDAEQNFEQLQALLKDKADLSAIAALRQSSDNEYAECADLFEQRRLQGFIRECHGDLHLGNIVLIAGMPVPFDGIEFNPALRWIDVMSEIAFTAMDLLRYQRAELAYRFINAYLEITGDFAGIRVLRFYMAYRAMVRAKVEAIRASQADLTRHAMALALSNCRAYLELAGNCLAKKRPALIITHGLPGSGKTTFSQLALERLHAMRLRSDVERKRLFGLSPLADSRTSIGIDLYSAEITQRIYVRLAELARLMLGAGYTVIVDAAFPKQAERDLFSQLAREMRVEFAIASIQAGNETLRARIMRRQQAANDASEADVGVLEKVVLTQQPLSAAEQKRTAIFVNEETGIAADASGWDHLNRLLGEAR